MLMRENFPSLTSWNIRIEGTDLPGRACGPGPDFPDGHHNIHVAAQGPEGIK